MPKKSSHSKSAIIFFAMIFAAHLAVNLIKAETVVLTKGEQLEIEVTKDEIFILLYRESSSMIVRKPGYGDLQIEIEGKKHDVFLALQQSQEDIFNQPLILAGPVKIFSNPKFTAPILISYIIAKNPGFKTIYHNTNRDFNFTIPEGKFAIFHRPSNVLDPSRIKAVGRITEANGSQMDAYELDLNRGLSTKNNNILSGPVSFDFLYEEGLDEDFKNPEISPVVTWTYYLADKLPIPFTPVLTLVGASSEHGISIQTSEDFEKWNTIGLLNPILNETHGFYRLKITE